MFSSGAARPASGDSASGEFTTGIPIVDGELPVYLALPNQSPFSSILIIHDINGANAFYRDVARRLALDGYMAILPDFFHRQGELPEPTREARFARMHSMKQTETLADIKAALLWAQKQEGCSGKIGTLGFCMGGTLALLAASREPVPAATVSYYGFPYRDKTENAPSIPLDDSEVRTVQSPLLAFWGLDDSGVGMNNVDRYEESLDQYNKAYEFVRYEGVGHGFLTFDEDSPAWSAAFDAWSSTLAFFKDELSAPTP